MTAAASTTAIVIFTPQGQLVRANELVLSLKNLVALAEKIQTTTREGKIVAIDAENCREAKELSKKFSDISNMILAIVEPERLKRKQALDDLVHQRDEILAQFAGPQERLDVSARNFDLEEKQAAAREQAKLNAKKKPDEQIIVKPVSTTVPGGKRTVPHYRAKVVDRKKLNGKWLGPRIKDEWIVTLVEEQARKDKDIAKTLATVGQGMKVWIE